MDTEQFTLLIENILNDEEVHGSSKKAKNDEKNELENADSHRTSIEGMVFLSFYLIKQTV